MSLHDVLGLGVQLFCQCDQERLVGDDIIQIPAKTPGEMAADRIVSGRKPETARNRPRRSSSLVRNEKAPSATFSASSRVTLFKGVFMLSVCISSIGLDLTISSDECLGR
jgi:hypothetical protein